MIAQAFADQITPVRSTLKPAIGMGALLAR
jgi:hypothetical protein